VCEYDDQVGSFSIYLNSDDVHKSSVGLVSWVFNGTVRYFTFSVLPFGLASACYYFTKLLRPLIKRWHGMSHAAFVYLDDGISGHKQHLDAVTASIIHKNDLTLSGLVANDEKCHWEPMQIGGMAWPYH
jgi:hypothetical protein